VQRQRECEECGQGDEQFAHGADVTIPARIRAPLDRPTAFVLAAAAAIRIAVNNVVVYSRADETVYLLYARSGFRRAVRMYLGDPGMWVFPNPLRWSWIGITSLACFDCRHRTLATLSTIAGILAVALTWWIARELFGSAVALVAAALAATSPLQLALGRRALGDEFVCAMVLASIAALLFYLRDPRPTRLVLWIVATTLAIAAKELFLFSYPLVLGFWWLRARKLRRLEVAAWLAPPLLFFALFCALAGDVTSFFAVARATASTATAATYPTQYQSGPPQRMLIDLMAVAPIVTCVAIAALIALRRHPLAALAFAMLAVHALLPSQNVRYIAAVEPLLRILAAAFLVTELRDRRWLAGGLIVNAAVELLLFYAIFIRAAVYDPVTDNLLRALKMLPR
jgi:4-amino-4-deoxy-L-arabinose transferase-like glycosyltransferase